MYMYYFISKPVPSFHTSVNVCRYSVDTPGISMTLWSSRKVANMRQNIEYGREPFSDEEEDILEEVRGRILKPISGTHWEEKLNKYHKFFDIYED